MSLKTLEPNPTWDPDAHKEAVETLRNHRNELRYKIWCGDWCKDCRGLLPSFGAALEAASIPNEHIEEHAVDRSKSGPLVDEYGVEYIPTIVVVRVEDGSEVTRFVESEDIPPADWIAQQLSAIIE